MGIENAKGRFGFAALVFLLIILPIILTPFPPSTDLPQHLAQIRLLGKALENPGGPYAIQWLGPNNLVYFLIYVLWTILPVAWTGRGILLVISLFWLAATHWLSFIKHRPLPETILASLLFFNSSLYWGFLNFLIGFPVFVGWFYLTTKMDFQKRSLYWLALSTMSFLLYESHALWFAAGALWLCYIAVVRRYRLKNFIFLFSSLFPCGFLALSWYLRFSSLRAASGYDVLPSWHSFYKFGGFVDSVFGGIEGPIEYITFIFLYGWMAIAVWQNRKRLRERMDENLVAAAIFFLMLFLVLPHKFMNTIYFSGRWMPIAMIFGLLSLPSMIGKRRNLLLISTGVLLFFVLMTASSWLKYSGDELSGFQEAINQVEPDSRVLGLDMLRNSHYIKGYPFLQMFSYTQVFRGSSLNFSFAEHYSGLVALREKRTDYRSSHLLFYPEDVQAHDFQSVDFVLVSGEKNVHYWISRFSDRLKPVTFGGNWRLYRVLKK